MKNFFGILIFLMLPMFCICQNSKKTDWQKDKMVGKVKKVEERFPYPYSSKKYICYNIKLYNGDGNAIFHRYDGPSLTLLDTFKYNTNGNLIKFIRHKMDYTSLNYIRDAVTDDLVPPIKLDKIVNYIYDKNGNIVQEVSKQYTHSIYKDSVSTESTFTYTTEGVLKEKNTYNDSNIRRVYIYDEKGNMIENNAYKFNRKQVYKYDANGNQTECLIYKRDKLKSKFVTVYDDNGNIIETYLYNSNNSLKTKHQYKYEYDSKGNWIKKITDGIVTTRAITYY